MDCPNCTVCVIVFYFRWPCRVVRCWLSDHLYIDLACCDDYLIRTCCFLHKFCPFTIVVRRTVWFPQTKPSRAGLARPHVLQPQGRSNKSAEVQFQPGTQRGGPQMRNNAFREPLLPAIGRCARIGLLSAKIYFRKSGSKAENR